MLVYRLILPEGSDVHGAFLKLKQLEEEDPQLHITWSSQLQEIQIQLMGQVQLEILKTRIKERFDLDAEFDTGRISYKETIAAPVTGAGHFEPLRHYAEVHLLLEPGERGSGLVLDTACSEDVLDRNWQRLILTHLGEKEHTGASDRFSHYRYKDHAAERQSACKTYRRRRFPPGNLPGAAAGAAESGNDSSGTVV